MANIKSAKKRILVTATKNAKNKAQRSALKTAIKKARADGAGAEQLKNAIVHLDKFASKGLIYKNKANRLKSRLTKKVGA